MANEVLEQTLRDAFSTKFEDNRIINDVLDKVERGICTYDDAYLFAREVGLISYDALKNIEWINEDVLETVRGLMEQNLNLVGGVCEEAQLLLNEAAEIGLKPVPPKKLKQLDKMDGIIESARNPVENSNPVVNLQRGTQTMTMALVDDWIKTNADFQADAGLSPMIVREWDGTWGKNDTRHTDWCSRLQGTYKYSDGIQGNFASGRRFFRPSQRFHNWDGSRDLFKRHEGCQCKITYYPNEKAKGVITALAKGEKDTNKQLWNTGKEFSQSRNSVLRRRREKFGKEKAREMLNKEWQGGLNGLAERHFS